MPTARRVAVVVAWATQATVLGSGLIWLGASIEDARLAARASTAKGPFKRIELAFHAYHDRYGCFPPAYVADEAGRPMHSWRVLLMPFLSSPQISQRYRFDEPWDSPNNRKLVDDFACREFHFEAESPDPRFTNIVVVVGEGTVFPGTRSVSKGEISDGLENTILFTEITDSDILWSEPRDLRLEGLEVQKRRTNPNSISSAGWRQPRANRIGADGDRQFTIPFDIPARSLRALLTIAGGEGRFEDFIPVTGFDDKPRWRPYDLR